MALQYCANPIAAMLPFLMLPSPVPRTGDLTDQQQHICHCIRSQRGRTLGLRHRTEYHRLYRNFDGSVAGQLVGATVGTAQYPCYNASGYVFSGNVCGGGCGGADVCGFGTAPTEVDSKEGCLPFVRVMDAVCCVYRGSAGQLPL